MMKMISSTNHHVDQRRHVDFRIGLALAAPAYAHGHVSSLSYRVNVG